MWIRAWPLLTVFWTGFALAQDKGPTVLSFTVGEDQLQLEPGHIESIELTPLGTGEEGVSVVLTPESGLAFADFTERHVGKKLTVRVCGNVVLEPYVRERIAGGRLLITTSSPEDAERLADQLWLAEDCGPAQASE